MGSSRFARKYSLGTGWGNSRGTRASPLRCTAPSYCCYCSLSAASSSTNAAARCVQLRLRLPSPAARVRRPVSRSLCERCARAPYRESTPRCPSRCESRRAAARIKQIRAITSTSDEMNSLQHLPPANAYSQVNSPELREGSRQLSTRRARGRRRRRCRARGGSETRAAR